MKLALLAGFLVLLGLAGILTTTILRWKVTDYELTDYGVILDAGSTSTRAYVYQWDRKTTATLPTVAVSTLYNGNPCSTVIRPGIIEIDTNNVGDYLAPVLEWAKEIVPKDNIAATPIFLRGTGGLRQLPSDQSSALLSAVQNVLMSSGFSFDTSYASILTGEQEAAYGFIAVNTLYGSFIDNTDPTNTYGSLDMGGVSAEIAFVPTGQPPVNYSFTTSINGTSYPIYVQSYDNLGLNEARYNFNTSLFLGNSNAGNGSLVFDACLPLGYHEIVTTTVNGQLQSFLLSGMSNPSQCWAQVQQFVQTITASYPSPPIRSGLPFVAADKYYEINKFFELYEDSSIAELEEAAKVYCALDYEGEINQYSDYATTVQNYCFYGMYVAALLENYVGLSSTTRVLLWQKNVNSSPVTWTLGNVVDYVNGLTPDSAPVYPSHHIRYFQTDAGVIIVFTSILVFLLGIILFILQRRRPSDYVLITEQ